MPANKIHSTIKNDVKKMKLQIHTQSTAPDASKPLLDQSLKDFGMIPNLHAVMAESPGVLESYKFLHQQFQKSNFNADEFTVIWQTINVEHECHYCVAAHTGIANMMKVDAAITDALRQRTQMPSSKLQVLHETTLELVRERGYLAESSHAAFFEAGYDNQQLLDIVLGISQKVLSNYINHLAVTPVDKAFEALVWNK
ncbi:MAG: alkylhydroperoxidase family enzyme [Arenicella sp.]